MKSKFYDYHKPDLKAGKYQLKVTLDGKGIQLLNENKIDESVQNFFVSGQRFNIPSSAFNSCYPPESGKGDFSKCLPHLVFNKSTLPWEWGLGLKAKGLQLPWLALFLFHENEIPKLEPVNIGNLFNDIWKGKVEKTMGEDLNSDCLCIELSSSLFNNLMPRLSELPYLFHVKTTENEKHAVAVTNRLPKNGLNEVHLVSLFGWNGEAATDNIKLVSLKKWSFESKDDEKGDFSDIMNELKVGSIQNKAFYGSKQLSENLQNTLSKRGEQGFSILPHKTINGQVISAWYRGPFIPFEKDKLKTKYILQNTSLNHDIHTDNISYSSAWQLGQLLALKDKIFIQNLQNWKQSALKSADGKTANNYLDGILKSLNDTSLLNSCQTTTLSTNKTESNSVELFIIDWLKELSLLRGVPFYYLIPSSQILSKMGTGELALFYLDQEWIESLLCGALSFLFMGSQQTSTLLIEKSNELLLKIAFKTVSGFILQSSAVKDWPDMKFEALNNDVILPVLKSEKLNDDILIALFDGSYDCISFAEPFHNLHFGFEENGSRKIGDSTVKLQLRDSQHLVLDIEKLTTDIGNAILPKTISPALWAINMVDLADKIIFKK